MRVTARDANTFPYLPMICDSQSECPALVRASLYTRGCDKQLVAVLIFCRNMRGCTIRVYDTYTPYTGLFSQEKYDGA